MTERPEVDPASPLQFVINAGAGASDMATKREAIEAKYDSLVAPILGTAGAKRLHDVIERIDSLTDVGELARASAKA